MAENASYWRVAGGVLVGGLAGVGAVALSPLFGGALVLTGVGAAVGTVVGGTVGGTVAGMSDPEEGMASAKMQAKEEVRNEFKAEYIVIIEDLKRQIVRYREQIEAEHQHSGDQSAFDELTLNMYGVGLAGLRHCHVCGPNNQQDLKLFVFGAAHAHLPPAILARITEIEGGVPTLAGAYARAFEMPPATHELFELMVDFVAMLFDTSGKHHLVSTWARLRAA